MTFWIIITGLSLICGAILGLTLVRGRTGDEPPAAYDLRVYRDQLREVDRDEARRVVSGEEAERIRTEVSRRILAADAALREGGRAAGQPRWAGPVAAGLAVLVLAGASAWLYLHFGAPGYRDRPLQARLDASAEARANRLTQAEAQARVPPAPAPDVSDDYLDLMEKLRETVAERPDDLRGLRLLVRNEAALGNLEAAHEAQARITEIRGQSATAGEYAHLADLMIGAAGGYVSVEAEAALREALRRNPDEPRARYYLGLYLMQVDRPDGAFRIWEELLRNSPPDAPWTRPIRLQIEDAAQRAGVRYELPPQAPAAGPTAEDIEAAEDLSAQERQEMILGMVARLSDRLAREGGEPEDWARLIAAYGVLGEPGRARDVWAEAQQVFDANPQALARIRRAAKDAGVAE